MQGWPSLAATACQDYPEFLPLMWDIISKSAMKLRGNGDHLELLATLCLHHGKVPIRQNQIQLWEIMESSYANIFDIYWNDVSRKGPSEGILDVTDNIYFFGRFLEVIGHVAMGNARILEAVQKEPKFSFEVLTDQIFDTRLPLYIRSMLAKLTGILYLEKYESLDPSQGIRMSPGALNAMKTTQASGTPRALLSACDPLRAKLESYLQTLDPVVNPDNLNTNILTLQAIKLVNRLLVIGSFATDAAFLADGNILLSPNVTNLLAVLTHHLHVDDDLAEENELSKYTATEKSKVVMLIKLEVLKAMDYIVELWQSTRLNAVVINVAADLRPASGTQMKISKSRSPRDEKMINSWDNPIFDTDADADTFEVASAPTSEHASRKMNTTSCDAEAEQSMFSFDKAYMTKVVAATENILLFAPTKADDAKMRDSLGVSLMELLRYELPSLRMHAFQSLCNIMMPSAKLLTLVGDTQLLSTKAEGMTYQTVRKHKVDLRRLIMLLPDEDALKQLQALVMVLIDTCDDVAERSFRVMMADLHFHDLLIECAGNAGCKF